MDAWQMSTAIWKFIFRRLFLFFGFYAVVGWIQFSAPEMFVKLEENIYVYTSRWTMERSTFLNAIYQNRMDRIFNKLKATPSHLPFIFGGWKWESNRVQYQIDIDKFVPWGCQKETKKTRISNSTTDREHTSTNVECHLIGPCAQQFLIFPSNWWLLLMKLMNNIT